jgi:hypothetical protein
MKKGFFKKVTKRQLVAETFSEEYIFVANFHTDRFVLETALNECRVNHPPAIQKRVKEMWLNEYSQG